MASGLDFVGWTTLNQLGSGPSALDERVLLDRVTAGLKIAQPQARAALTVLIERGLIAQHLIETKPTVSRQLSMTHAGSVVFDRITVTIADIVERLYGGLPAEDLAVTQRLLATVTARANAELAG